jgi:pilus assembly protein CpaD
MVANPEDLFHGREGSGVGDSATASRAINAYRTAPTTGSKGLQDINTKKDQ